MGSENVKLRKRNFTTFDGYFYTIDEDQDNLLQKTDDGNTSFSYPLDTALSASEDVLSLEYDGVYFWSLSASGTNSAQIRRWKIDNFVCKLQQKIVLNPSGSHKYQTEAFSIEHYHDTLSATAASGSTTIGLTTYSGHSSLSTGLTIHLGPNTNGQEEDVTVNTVSSEGATLVSSTNFDHANGGEVNYYTNIWLLNDYNGTNLTGALYKFDRNGNFTRKYASGAYFNVQAATFFKVDSFPEFGDVNTLAYIRNSNTLFVNVLSTADELPFYGSMVMENIQDDDATILPVYDLAMDGSNVYRLQLGPDDGSGETWSPLYSYELSSLDSFVTSISLAADPAIIAANLVSTSSIVAFVRDQFWNPIASRAVTYSIGSPGGTAPTIVSANPSNTNPNGRSTAVMKSGDTAGEVTVTATVEQT